MMMMETIHEGCRPCSAQAITTEKYNEQVRTTYEVRMEEIISQAHSTLLTITAENTSHTATRRF